MNALRHTWPEHEEPAHCPDCGVDRTLLGICTAQRGPRGRTCSQSEADDRRARRVTWVCTIVYVVVLVCVAVARQKGLLP